MSEGSKSRSIRIALKGLTGSNKGTYRISPDLDEKPDFNTIAKGHTNGDVTGSTSPSIGEKTLTRESESSSSYHIEIPKLRVILNRLREHAFTDKEKLPTALKDDLNTIKQIYMSIDADTGRDQLSCLIDEVFGDINLLNIVPNTVAAFFLGCKSSNCSGVPLGCSPQCADSLPSDPNLTGYAPCDASVYLLRDGVLTLSTHGTANNGNAYVYVDAGFTRYSNNVIQRLAQNKVKAVKTVRLDGGKCVQIAADFVPLAKLMSHSRPNHDDTMGGMSSNFWMWVLIILLVILVIGGIWVLSCKNRYAGGKPEYIEKTVVEEKTVISEKPLANPSLSPEFFRSMANTFSSPM